jgi:hypothetical protein
METEFPSDNEIKTLIFEIKELRKAHEGFNNLKRAQRQWEKMMINSTYGKINFGDKGSQTGKS